MIILPTIDVEGVHGSRPFEQMILGEVGDKETWGVFCLARIFQRHGISATFFVDCYEYTLWGEANMERICQQLADMGQDVQLHTHPAWRDDPRDADWLRKYKRTNSFLTPERDFMAKLSLDEQVSVLEAGIELFKKWLGSRPIAHRSGGYSINADTIRALRQTGFAIDSSMNASHPNSQLVWSYNRVEHQEGIIEIPVTVMKFLIGLPRRRPSASSVGKLKKTDLNVCSTNDLEAFIQQGMQSGLHIMNLFMHSYSLLDYKSFLRPDFTSIRPKRRCLRTLESFLDSAVSNSSTQFMSCSTFLEQIRNSPDRFSGPDFIPSIYSPATLGYHAVRKASEGMSRAWNRLARSRYRLESEMPALQEELNR